MRHLLFAALLACAPLALAEDEHPLDAKMQKLMDDAGSTREQIAPADTSRKLWDAELNRTYQKLRAAIPSPASAALQAAQRKWLEFRDVEFALIDAAYDQIEGTMYLPMRVSAKAQVIRRRALELKAHLELLEAPGQ